MSLVTRCPRCKTLYRVAPAQLQARAGQVRCGRCMHVFDGFEALAVEQQNAVSEPVRFEPEAREAKAVETTAAPPGAPATSGLEGKKVPEGNHGLPSVERKEVPEGNHGFPSVRDTPPEFVGPPRPPLRFRMRRRAAGRAAAMKAKYIRKPSPVARRIAACALLAVLLAGQTAYAFRAPLAARYPGFKSVMLEVCDIAGCGVWLPHRPDLLQKVGEDVSALDAARPGLIQVTVTLRSAAGFDLAYPALDLVLTNANEHALARRIFLPEEYLGRGGDPRAGIPPKAELTLALELDTGDLYASGFRIDLLPAPAP